MSVQNESAAARWERLAGRRLDEMRRLAPDAGSVSGSFWDKGRAERYAQHLRLADPARDPFLRRLLRATGAAASAIDVGAGTGRYALALAREVAHVTAVDPSASMLAVLEREGEELGLTNVTTVAATWADADVEPADVAFSSYVLPLVVDARAFLAKLDASARARALLFLGAFSGDAAVDPLWRRFHPEPRAPGPSYLDAIEILRELGIEPRVKLVEIPNRRRYATIDEAVEQYRDWMFLPDTEDVRAELADLLGHWLLGRRGAYRSTLRATPAAIIEWRPRANAG